MNECNHSKKNRIIKVKFNIICSTRESFISLHLTLVKYKSSTFKSFSSSDKVIWFYTSSNFFDKDKLKNF